MASLLRAPPGAGSYRSSGGVGCSGVVAMACTNQRCGWPGYRWGRGPDWATTGVIRPVTEIQRSVDVTVDDFTGYALAVDLIAWDMPGAGARYQAQGGARVRNVELPAGYSHVFVPRNSHLAAAGRGPCGRQQPVGGRCLVPHQEALGARGAEGGARQARAGARAGAGAGGRPASTLRSRRLDLCHNRRQSKS